MWVDESGGTDADAGAGDGEMTVTVDGEEYTADVNYDMDHDGVDDTAVIETADGGGQAFVDTDHDGSADEYVVLDEQGDVTQHATYDDASGDWVDAGGHGGDTHTTDSQTSSGGTINADLPNGDVQVGAATVDTDHDGVNDTAVVEDDQGNTIGFTDADGDGQADVAVVISPTGDSTVYEHTGDGQWTESTHTGAAGDTGSHSSLAGDQAWGGGQEAVEGVARIDSTTGQWISQN